MITFYLYVFRQLHVLCFPSFTHFTLSFYTISPICSSYFYLSLFLSFFFYLFIHLLTTHTPTHQSISLYLSIYFLFSFLALFVQTVCIRLRLRLPFLSWSLSIYSFSNNSYQNFPLIIEVYDFYIFLDTPVLAYLTVINIIVI